MALVVAGVTLTACLGGEDDEGSDEGSVAQTDQSSGDGAGDGALMTGGGLLAGDEDTASATGDEDPAGGGSGEDTGDDTGEEDAVSPAEQALPSDESTMERVDYITGGITPKSVVASGHGLVIANNMMYSHTMTVYDSTSRELLETLSDSVVMEDFGIPDHPGESSGSPVEAAWTDNGKYAYVSQYTMYGQNFGVEGFDDCSPQSGVGASYLYRFNAELMDWDQVIKVGAVPKYVDITPDQTRVLVSNWCDSTISVVDRESATEVEVIPVDAAPRGIEVLPDNRTAYVAAMYANKLFKVDLEEGTSELMMDTTRKPRHLNLSPDGKYLYMAVSGANTIYKIDTETEEIVDEVVSGAEPRSMSISPDGTALYVVNYYEPSVAKIATEDMEVLQTEPTDANPIGITYDPVTHQVWVACYGGSLYVFDDQAGAAGD
ncbi:YncE family protein [Ornithinicoccus hortensis]|uniref:YncE family protein n=1 Tax=Ornithinicoccus hortensis TaxID=82346 RepID=UPI001E4A80C0|nr:YncE family protein [Ornithinicoccus hortensis]